MPQQNIAAILRSNMPPKKEHHWCHFGHFGSVDHFGNAPHLKMVTVVMRPNQCTQSNHLNMLHSPYSMWYAGEYVGCIQQPNQQCGINAQCVLPPPFRPVCDLSTGTGMPVTAAGHATGWQEDSIHRDLHRDLHRVSMHHKRRCTLLIEAENGPIRLKILQEGSSKKSLLR